MKAVRRRDTDVELALRSELHRRGLRFRVDRAPSVNSRARADLLFATERVAVFVDGCYWHGCPDHATTPKTNTAWWEQKIDANRLRDQRVSEALRAEGWTVLRVWSHVPVTTAADTVEWAVRERRRSPQRDTVQRYLASR